MYCIFIVRILLGAMVLTATPFYETRNRLMNFNSLTAFVEYYINKTNLDYKFHKVWFHASMPLKNYYISSPQLLLCY